MIKTQYNEYYEKKKINRKQIFFNQRSVLFPFLFNCYYSPDITSDFSLSDACNSKIYLSYCLNFSSSSSYERL